MAIALLRPDKALTAAKSEFAPPVAAEIAKRIDALREEDNRVTNELREIYLSRTGPGGSAPQPLSDHEKRVRAKLYERMGQDAPPVNDVDREADLLADRGAIRKLMEVLGREQTARETVEALEWKKANLSKWMALAREIVMASMKLDELSHKARAMFAEGNGWTRMPGDLFAAQRVEIRFGDLVQHEVWREAVDAQIVKLTEISEAVARHEA